MSVSQVWRKCSHCAADAKATRRKCAPPARACVSPQAAPSPDTTRHPFAQARTHDLSVRRVALERRVGVVRKTVIDLAVTR